MSARPSAAFARELVNALAVHGVEDFVLAPGSRSGPLAHALAEAGSRNPPLGAPRVNLHVRVDERSAAFLALGIARGRAIAGPARAVGLVTTSGTAVGNLMPAVMEAHHSGVPIVLLTADRPGELRGVGANQTTDQVGLFDRFVRWSSDVSAPLDDEAAGRASRLAARAVSEAIGSPSRDDMTGVPGPVHLNVEFRDPLGPDGGSWPDVARVDPTPSGSLYVVPPWSVGEIPALKSADRGVVIAGDGAGDAARIVAEVHSWPLLAEPTSGARVGPTCIPDYARFLTSAAGRDLAQQVQQVVVIGRPTLSRSVQMLIANASSLLVAGHGARWREAPLHATRVLHRVPQSWLTSDAPPAPQWLDAWRRAAPRAAPRDGWNSRSVAAEFVASLDSSGIGVIGSSGAIRAVDRVAPAWTSESAPVLLANRGVSGIDGTVSTAIGVALGAGAPVSALLGDLTFLHDIGGLLVGPLERRPDVRIVVLNDGGGTIFGDLEHATGPAEHVERVFTTPHGAALGDLCAGYGVPHLVARSTPELGAALRRPRRGIDVVEAVLAGTQFG